MRAEELAEERARRKAEEQCAESGQKTVPPKRRKVKSGQKTAPPKKRKAIPPELEERQKRASTHMLELGVPPLQVKIYFLLLKTCNLFNYLLFPCIYCLIFFSTYETFFCSVSSFTFF